MAEGSLRQTRRELPGGNDLPPPLVEAKIAVPSVRKGVVERPRIREALDAVGDSTLALVSAPAGYGKTTAVRSWCAGVGAALAWVTLDQADNDPVRLWRYVATAVDRVRPGLGRGSLQRLGIPGRSLEEAVDELMNGIAALGSDFLLVLDDLQAVTNEQSVASLNYALEHLPHNARAVIVTRVDPALRLPRFRARGALVEIRLNDLAFTAAEAHELLVERGRLELGPEELDVLVERTEGWPAALVLARLWLATVDDTAEAVRAFGGGHRFVAEYLSSEVLASLTDDSRAFLQGAAVLGELTAELADAVLDRSDSKAQLAELERSNLFVLRLERGNWYRIHSLFGEYARAQLALSDPAAEPTIHRRAAEWFKARGMAVEAVSHAAAAHEHDFVASILVDYHVTLITSGQSRTLLHWVNTLPDDCIVAHPELTVAAAIAAILEGGSQIEQHRYLRLADQARAESESPIPYVETWRLVARALMIEGGVRQAVTDARQAVERAENEPAIIGGALVACARALFFADETEEAFDVALRALEEPGMDGRPPVLVLARTTLALVEVERGHLTPARVHAENAKAIVGRIGSSRSWLGANASSALGAVLVAEGDLAAAEREFAAAEHHFGGEIATLHWAWLLCQLARVRVRRGHIDEAEQTARSARDALRAISDSGRVAALADEMERELAGAQARAGSGELLDPPSAAELSVLRLMATDLSMREIGDQLYLSLNTIRSHIRALYRKLGVHSREDAVARATALGLIEQTESPG